MKTPVAAARGFTLIELLVVIAILSLLLGMATIGLGRYRGQGKQAATVTRITGLETLLEVYRNKKGDYPSSRLSDYGIKAPNAVNEGIEALVIALNHKDYDGDIMDESWLLNNDNDRATTSITKFPSADLFEVVDAWDNPIIYLRYDVYDEQHDYEFMNVDTSEVVLERVKGMVSEKTGAFYDQQKYQLRSAGEDGVLGTADDVTSY